MTLEDATRLLAEAEIENPRGEARLLLAHALGIDRDATLTATPTPDQAMRFAALVSRRTVHEPFAYITGAKEFWSMAFDVGPGVLVPRPDTETLIEEALRVIPDRSAALRIADLGTGSGAILLAALTEFPNARGVGFESAPQAFAWAKANTERLAPGRAEIRLADWDAADGPFDLVFSNPPYIPSGDIESLALDVSRFEPRGALDGGPDGLDAYRALGTLLPRILSPGGHALLEIGIGQANSMERLFPELELVRIAPDLAGIPRCVVLRNRKDCLGKTPSIG
ncbi:MAG: Release factor glutamine methyltransferase [Alphaproteobacteria bacterium]|nr:Release factor glutamine methyltransferase [Alphaproteobacteria bacterium]MDB5739187.1 Release factor glutamine methyltransferase [Alphaproteobacteria bacterium]